MNHIQTLFLVLFSSSLSFGSFAQFDSNRVNDPFLAENGDPVVVILDNGSSAFVFSDPRESSVSMDVPLTDENGETIILNNEDGTQSYVFPDPQFVYVPVGIPLIDENGVQTSIPSDVPFVDQSGNSIIVILEDGTRSFIFPN